MTGTVWQSALVAALFAVHPLRVESVAWVAERKDVVSALFAMLTLVAYDGYVKHPGVGRYALVLVAFALALLAKPMFVTLPCVLLLLDYWPLRRHINATRQRGSLSRLGLMCPAGKHSLLTGLASSGSWPKSCHSLAWLLPRVS